MSKAKPCNDRYYGAEGILGFPVERIEDRGIKKVPDKTGTSVSGKRDSNSRPRPWQGRALPTELLPHFLTDGKYTIFILSFATDLNEKSSFFPLLLPAMYTTRLALCF